MIGDDVQITIVDIRGDKVRLGITAPRHIQVHRKEVYDAIKRENQQAAGLTPRDVAEVVQRDTVKDVSVKAPPPQATEEKVKKETEQRKELEGPDRSDRTARGA
jgi:carbon storage regulator